MFLAVVVRILLNIMELFEGVSLLIKLKHRIFFENYDDPSQKILGSLKFWVFLM